MLKAMINRLKKKEFRDAFVLSHITQGLAYQIYELRTQRGWTQKELAEKLGLKRQSAVARMEDPSYGKLSISTLVKLSSVFDVALSIRFQTYSKFLIEVEDVSPAALRAESFEDEMQTANNFQDIARFPNETSAHHSSQLKIDVLKSYHIKAQKVQNAQEVAWNLANGNHSPFYMPIVLIDKDKNSLPAINKTIEFQSTGSCSTISTIHTSTEYRVA
jgi:transcriptional regulator with XRE-family HTH domain